MEAENTSIDPSAPLAGEGAPRKIIHIDMDAFFASVEQRDNAEYRGKAIVVGGSPQGRGGVVAAASYEARIFGIHSAMPSKKASQLCPHLIFVKPRFEVYKAVSAQIREIFKRYTDCIEPLSLDEAYLDVTQDKRALGSSILIAQRIRAEIKQELGLTASAGVSVNKFVAKVASDLNKPDGLTFIAPQRVTSFMESLPIEKFYGVGKVTAKKMKALGIFTGADLKSYSLRQLQQHFGKQGRFFYGIVRGIDERPVQAHRISKSVGIEDTFPEDLTSDEEMKQALYELAQRLAVRIEKHGVRGRTLTLKIRLSDFSIQTRSRSFEAGVSSFQTIYTTAAALLDSYLALRLSDQPCQIRLLGITLSRFQRNAPGSSTQLTLFNTV